MTIPLIDLQQLNGPAAVVDRRGRPGMLLGRGALLGKLRVPVATIGQCDIRLDISAATGWYQSALCTAWAGLTGWVPGNPRSRICQPPCSSGSTWARC
jgi:hypothetical protein